MRTVPVDEQWHDGRPCRRLPAIGASRVRDKQLRGGRYAQVNSGRSTVHLQSCADVVKENARFVTESRDYRRS